MTTPPVRDRVHLAPNGLVLTDSDLALLARGLGHIVTWPVLRGSAPPQALHMAAIRTTVFGGRAGGNMLAAMATYDATRREHDGTEPFGAHFIAACTLAGVKEKRRERPATRDAEAGADVLRMWLGG